MIYNKIVRGGPQLKLPEHRSFSKYVLNKLKLYSSRDEMAMINGNTMEGVSYKELLYKVVSIASGLRKLGLKHGDVVAICGQNCIEYIAITVAVLCVGATITTLNIKYTKDETLHVLNLSKPRLVFCSQSALETKLTMIKEASCVEYIIGIDCVSENGSLETMMVETDAERFEPEPVVGDTDVGFILYSSGTTGLVKGVMLTHVNLLYACTIYNYSDEIKSRILTMTPWYHIYGLLTTIQYISSNNLVVFMPDFNPELLLSTIEKYKITQVLAVPPIVVILAKSYLTDKYDLSSVEVVWCAAAPLAGSTIKQAMKNLPNCKNILQGYGMTETTLVVVKEPEDKPGRPGSCGQPLPGVEAKVVNIITREHLGPNEQGEICLKSPSLMKGYKNNEKATKDMFDEDGFIKTGDIGYYDNDGYFYVVDRLKEIIKYKGQQVAPAAVESVILQHPGVAECGVVGKHDEFAGELPTAFVVPKAGVHITEHDILDFTATKLSPISRLRGGVIFVKEIPKNGSGKILRRVLRDQLNDLINIS